MESWYCVTCEKCEGSFDISEKDVMSIVIPDGTRIKLGNGEIGILYWNDKEDSEEFTDINYAYISNEDAKKYDGKWNNVCKFMRLQDLIDNHFEIVNCEYKELI